MAAIKNIAIVGASGNFGKPITAALLKVGFNITIITRTNSTTQHPANVPTIRTEYTQEALTRAFTNQDAVVCVVGPGGIGLQVTFVDAAEAAGVKRFIIDDFGWGPTVSAFPEFDAIHAQRCVGWDHAKARAEANPRFSWTGISVGNPIDWAVKKFPLMGFEITNHHAIIYDDGTEQFTGTTLAGIGQAVLGVMQNPDETANRFVKVLSLVTCQRDLLAAFEQIEGVKWHVQKDTTEALAQRGREKHQAGTGGWLLDLVVAQLYDKGQSRCRVAPFRAESDSILLGVPEESALDVVGRIFKAQEEGVSAVW